MPEFMLDDVSIWVRLSSALYLLVFMISLHFYKKPEKTDILIGNLLFSSGALFYALTKDNMIASAVSTMILFYTVLKYGQFRGFIKLSKFQDIGILGTILAAGVGMSYQVPLDSVIVLAFIAARVGEFVPSAVLNKVLYFVAGCLYIVFGSLTNMPMMMLINLFFVTAMVYAPLKAHLTALFQPVKA